MLAIVVDYLTSPWKVWHIGFTGITIYLALRLAILFIIDGKNSIHEFQGRLNIALALAFILFAINAIFKIVFNYYILDFDEFERITLIVTSIAIFCAVLLMESIVRTNHIFSIISFFTSIFFFFIKIDSIYVWIGFGLMGITMIFPIQFVYSLFKRGGRYLKGRILFVITSVLVLYTGVVMDFRRVQIFLPSEEYIIVGYFLQGLGMIGIFSAFRDMNIFDEADWQNYVEELYIINKSNLEPLFYQNFKTGKQEMEKETLALISGGLIGINEMFKEISETQSGKKGVSLIEEQGKFVIMEHGQNVMACFVSKKDLKTLHFFLRKIRDVFDKYFFYQLTGWADIKDDIYQSIPRTLSTIFQGKKDKEGLY